MERKDKKDIIVIDSKSLIYKIYSRYAAINQNKQKENFM